MENVEEKNNTSKIKSYKKFNHKKSYQYRNELKQELTKATKLIEYFAIIGLDPKISIEKFLFNSSIEELEQFYSKELKPEIITKYPPINKSYINIDDSLIELCFPNGFKLEMHESLPEPHIMNFLLGNYFYSIDYPLKYITCLKFYESLENYYKLYEKINKDFRVNRYNLRKSSKNYFNYDPFSDNEIITRNSVASTKKIRDFFLEEKNKIKESDFNKYYFPKIICFVSLKPFYEYQKKILLQIYDYYKNQEKIKIPLEKIILNILCNIPMPPKGLAVYQYNLDEKNEIIDIKSVKMNKFKNIDDDLIIIFKYFNVNNFIEIFKYVLFETKTIVFGTNINHLCSFVYGLISLLYPFTYPFQVSSSIHKNAYEVLESISPYIIGINQKYSDSFFSDNKIEIKGTNFITIDLDNKEFILNIVEDIPNIPKNLNKRLKTKIETNMKKYEKNKNDENEENWICYAFFDFFLNILNNYGDYLNNDNFKKNYKISSLKILFKIKEFIESHSSNERDFYKKFVETQMFNDFIFKKMIPNNVDDKLEILFFDENINKKNNKKFFSKNKSISFLTSKEYEYKSKYPIPRIKELILREKKRYIDKNYKLNNLLLGQEIILENTKSNNNNNINDLYQEEKITNEEEKNCLENIEDINFYFNYILFPKFNKDFFNDPSFEYFQFTSTFASDIKRINTDLLAKSHSSSGEILYDEGMLDYIYLTYIEVWGYSYWYQDIIERDYRFDQMLNVLNKIKHQEIELINVLFESLNKFQEKEKILRLYDRLLKYNITPNSFIYSIVGKIVKKRDDSLEVISDIKNIEKNNFLRRTFRSEKETNILGDSITFNFIQECPDCNKLIDVENISNEYKKMRKDLLWAKCPFCLNYIKPQITVNFGSSISSKYLKLPCSKVEIFNLDSPYELKNGIKEIIDKEELHLLDIDKFKSKFPNIFWSCIWYFNLYNLDYDIILPYEVNIFKQKTKSSVLNLHYINSKIPANLKNDNNNEININKNIINDNNYNTNKNVFIIQNNYSFLYINNFCYDYFGTFKKSNKVDLGNYKDFRRKKTITNHDKRTISGFFNVDVNKILSDKNVIKNQKDKHKSPNFGRSHQNGINENDELKYYDSKISENKNNVDIDLTINNPNKVNQVNIIRISNNQNNNEDDDNLDSKRSNSSSLSEN